MAIFDDTLEVRLCSPDYTEDWGPVGNPSTVVLTRTRHTPSVLELHVDADSPQWELLLREMCGVQVRFRGKTEFLGHVYTRRGGIQPDSPMQVWAREETEEFDNTLGWVVPERIQFAGSFGGIFSTGQIEPTELLDQAQSFPDPWIDPGHYNWGWPYWAMPFSPIEVGHFIGPMIVSNLRRKGYARSQLVSTDGATVRPMENLFTNAAGAPFRVVEPDRDTWLSDRWTPPWIGSFGGASVRFSTLREGVAPFMAWADIYTDDSFSLYADGEIGKGVVLGYRRNPQPYQVPLSASAGTVVDGSWSISDHTASRVILGGPGDMRERMFAEFRAPDREDAGRKIEVFKDSTGISLQTDDTGEGQYEGWPRGYFIDPTVKEIYKERVRSNLLRAAQAVFNDAAPRRGISVELQETSEIYYGGESGYQLGQLVTVDLGWIKFAERVEQVTISLTTDNGLTVKPQVGDRDDDADDMYAQTLAALQATQRRNTSER